MLEDLKIIDYPDPRLRKVSIKVTQFDPALRTLVDRMFTLMREHKGVGLAAPQVGHNIRLFVMNATGEPSGDRVYVNPELLDVEGEEEDEEGCLSLPNIRVNIWRGKKVRMQAHALDGSPIHENESGFVARVWQHEMDHLNGALIIDRMGPTDKLATRKVLRELEEKFLARKKRPLSL